MKDFKSEILSISKNYIVLLNDKKESNAINLFFKKIKNKKTSIHFSAAHMTLK